MIHLIHLSFNVVVGLATRGERKLEEKRETAERGIWLSRLMKKIKIDLLPPPDFEAFSVGLVCGDDDLVVMILAVAVAEVEKFQ